MSSLWRRHNEGSARTPGRSVARRAALGTLVVAGVLSTVVSVSAAGRPTTASTTLAPVAAHARTAAASAAADRSTASGTTSTSTRTGAPTASSGATRTAMTMPATKTVAIKGYAFSPASLQVNVGDTVTWTNEDTAPHTVTVTSGPTTFSSGNLAKGESFSYTFTQPGTYSYYCAVHPDMVATVTVVGDPASDPAPSPSPSPAPAPAACGGVDAAVDAFLQHFYAAHLETSPFQQVKDALSVDQYTKTHTVLVEHMLAPLVGGSHEALDVFLQHLYAAHLETSPTQQVSDALALDKYVKTHTVLIENMIKPLVGGDVTSC